MMISHFRVKNFKCFRDTGPLDIRPITILLGLNSSGKSTILQALMALKQTVSSRDNTTSLIADGEYVKLGTYTDFVHGHSPDKHVTFEWVMPWQPSHALGRASFLRGVPWAKEIQSVSVELILSQNRKTKIIYPRQYTLRTNTDVLILKVNCAANGEPRRLETDLDLNAWTRRFWRQWLSRENFHFDLFARPVPSRHRSSTEERIEAFEQRSIASSLTALSHDLARASFDNMLCLAPVRDYPVRMNIVGGETPPDVGLRGESTVHMLLARRQMGEWPGLSDDIEHWLSKCGIARELRLESIARGVVSVRMTDPTLKVESSLADVGFGASQVLPVIVQGLCARRGTLLLVEQPEIHLHPSAQAEIGDFLIQTSRQGKSWLIETHSEHLLLRILRRIAERRIKRDNVAIYFVERARGKSSIRALEIDDYGGIAEWPKDFFATDFYESQARAIAAATRANTDRGTGN